MTDEELCEALIEEGILIGTDQPKKYWLNCRTVYFDSEGSALKDWRVAGACLERMTIAEKDQTFLFKDAQNGSWTIAHISNPRAIITAFVESRK